MTSLVGFAFEVFGQVQGVGFRYYTRRKATSLGVVGWCRNTNRNTVEGEVYGPQESVQQMKVWLSSVGSPSSRIDRCVFKNEVSDLKELKCYNFEVLH